MLPELVRPTPPDAEGLGISGDLSVSRIWPRGAGRVSLELLGPAGELLAGQMIDDDGDRRRIMTATTRRARAGADVLLAPAVLKPARSWCRPTARTGDCRPCRTC